MQDRKTLSAPVELSDAALDQVVGGCVCVSGLINGNGAPVTQAQACQATSGNVHAFSGFDNNQNHTPAHCGCDLLPPPPA
jgi:hypothetical protein